MKTNTTHHSHPTLVVLYRIELLEEVWERLAGASRIQNRHRHASTCREREAHRHAVIIIRLDFDVGVELLAFFQPVDDKVVAAFLDRDAKFC